ncbi:carboxylesterase/lipase family protein [Salininema proteolyticum]|uniref:Carboxylic ester hydrolase n=1 Tax=Salininema proteolyticum TaxID=1607685 RepID=A0ABV8U3N6_9ACTN
MNAGKRIAGVLAGVLAAVAAGGASYAGDPGPVRVETDKGVVEGVREDGVRTWKGIPYAAPPVGELRWEAPREAAAWDGVLPADEFEGPCAQPRGNIPGIPGDDEDCLYLNVYAPEGADGDLPVMVWFHGGGNTYGAARQYDPTRLAENGAVVVTVDYRQGVFANLTGPSLDGDRVESGNYGLQDQQAALEWVRANASGFGGDEGNVTVFGESGGGFDVCAHLVSASSEGLFDRAVMQSSPCAAPDWAPGLEESRAWTGEIAASLDCDDAECLRERSAAELLDAADAVLDEGVGFIEYQPVVGGPVMPVSTREALEAGRVNDAEVLLGINRDEMQMMPAAEEAATGTPMTEEDYRARLELHFGGDAGSVEAEYPASDFDNPGKAYGAVLTDSDWALPLAETRELLGERVPTFTYRLAEDDTPWFAGLDAPCWPVDSIHMVDVAFLFDSPIFEPRNARHDRLADVMTERWTEFARGGDPDGPGSWEPYAEDRDAWDLSSDGERGIDFEDEHLVDFWAGLHARES